jgi:hypothetical protein
MTATRALVAAQRTDGTAQAITRPATGGHTDRHPPRLTPRIFVIRNSMPGHEEAKKNCDTAASEGEVHLMASEPRPSELDEPDWLRHRIARLESLLPQVEDKQASTAIRELIAEAKERLARLEGSSS